MEAEPLLKRNERNKRPNNSNFLSKLFFWYAYPILSKGQTRNLELEDLYNNRDTDESFQLGDALAGAYSSEKLKLSKSPLLSALKRSYLRSYIYLCLMFFTREGLLRAGQAFLIGGFIRAFSPNVEDYRAATIYGISLVVSMILYVLIYQHSQFNAVYLAMKMRIATSSFVYRKTLKLSQAEIHSIGAGKITNMLSSDVGLLEYGIQYSPYLFVAPFSTTIFVLMIRAYVGECAWYGFGITVLLFPLQGLSSKFFGGLRLKCAAFTDARLRLISETINGILLIKMSTWEIPFNDLVAKARSSELNIFRYRALLNGIVVSLVQVTPKIALFVTLLLYVHQGNVLDAETAFVTSILFNGMANMLTAFLPFSIIYGAELLSSIGRIEKFLASEETVHYVNDNSTPKVHVPSVSLSSVYTRWGPESTTNGLSNISLKLNPGKFLAVIGPVGAGKTSLLLTILNEMEVYSGCISVNGNLAYTPQSPILFPGTVQDNILFGNPYRSEWYSQVVEACALVHDFQLLPYGDQTFVADKGVTLSGGQKSRISLARAVYRDADIYLLDDPLSSVDASVGNHLLHACLRGILKSKSLLLVTHLTHLCRKADEIIVLDRGKMVASGTYEYLSVLGHITDTSTDKVDDLLEDDAAETCIEERAAITGKVMMKNEAKTKTWVGMGMILKYLKFGNSAMVVALTIFITVLTQGLFSASDFVLKCWTQANSLLRADYQATNQFKLYFTLLMGPLTIMPFLKALVHYWTCFNSAEKLHGRIFWTLIKSPMEFFEVTPMGKILNRFSNDMRIADDALPQLLFQVSQMVLQILLTFVLVSWMSPISIVPVAIFIAISYALRQFHFKPASSLARLETTTKSPLFGHLSASIYGLTTIRAYGVQTRFQSMFDRLQNSQTSASFAVNTGNRWLGMVIQLLFTFYFAIIVVSVTFLCMGDPSTVGFIVPTLVFLSGTIAAMLSESADMGNQLVSIERILKYTKLEPEESETTTIGTTLRYRPPPNWPAQGTIRFRNVSISYVPGVNVLRGITCYISPNEKIGIVGRTGAGKTTLVSSLFRLVNLSAGSIEVDDVDILTLDLTTLRSKIAIIPQEPILFGGTLRKNLDPFSEIDDTLLWYALEDTQLNKRVRTDGLETEVGENGSNFSQGERQLISLARAMIRKCKILVLDEATAHVDSETDTLIQNLIKEKFRFCTIITIAHRLGTVMDSDRVCVMDSGEIVEFDAPKTLLEDERSRLSELVRSSKQFKRSGSSGF